MKYKTIIGTAIIAVSSTAFAGPVYTDPTQIVGYTALYIRILLRFL